MTAAALEIAPASNTPSADDLRTAALAHLGRAAALRDEADREERKAWRLRADVALAEVSKRRTPVRARRRPPVIGNPGLSMNRLISLMEKLGVDEDVNNHDGLDYPLRIVENQLGISYGDRRPAVGVRIANCESAFTPLGSAAGNDR